MYYVYIHSRNAAHVVDQIPYYVGVGSKVTAKMPKQNKTWKNMVATYGKVIDYTNADGYATFEEAAAIATQLVIEYLRNNYKLANVIDPATGLPIFKNPAPRKWLFVHENGVKEICTAYQLMKQYGLSHKIYWLTNNETLKYRGWSCFPLQNNKILDKTPKM